MIQHKRITVLFLAFLCLLLILSSAGPSFAENGDGTGPGDGSGNGENKDITLTLESASVRDGETGVAINETIQLNFNKNICNVLVLSNNKKCFHLTDASGEAVPIKLIFPDDQVQQDYKRQAFLIPREDLSKNTEYRVAVDNTLMAKNGTFIDNAHTITFTTGDSRTKEENSALKKLGDFTVTYETAYGETADSVPVNTEGLDDISEEEKPDTASIARLSAVILLTTVVAFSVVLFLLRRKRG